MKRLLVIIFLSFYSCEQKSHHKVMELNPTEEVFIELPKYDEWKESYVNLAVKNYFQETQVEGTTIHAIYLNNETAKKKDSIETLNLDDYAVVLTLDEDQKKKIAEYDLEYLRFKNNHFEMRSIDVNQLMADINSGKRELKRDKPVLMSSFWPKENIRSQQFLLKSDEYDGAMTIMTLNSFSIKNHLVHLAYYYNYYDKKSIEIASKKNEKIVIRFERYNT